MSATAANNDLPGRRFGPPGTYIIHGDRPVRTAPVLAGGVPAFLGCSRLDPSTYRRPDQASVVLNRWDPDLLGSVAPAEDSFLPAAVHGFFANGGKKCVVIGVPKQGGTQRLLELLEPGGILEDRSDIDLLCLPDATSLAPEDDPYSVQIAALEHCARMGDRFAILDSPGPGRSPGADSIQEVQRAVQQLRSTCGALYFPWIMVGRSDDRVDSAPEPGTVEWRRRSGNRSGSIEERAGYAPPCGHLAGLYARTEAVIGPQQSPANALLENVVDVSIHFDERTRASLNDSGVNCLLSRRGGGIEVGGARTLSNHSGLQFVSSARVYLGFRRWLAVGTRDLVFEPNDETLRDRVRRRLESRCQFLLEAGALAGDSPSEAYFVKCDDETNGMEARELGRIVAHVGLALSIPAEYIVIYVEHDPGGSGPDGLS
jgi:uncharacterized protein